ERLEPQAVVAREAEDELVRHRFEVAQGRVDDHALEAAARGRHDVGRVGQMMPAAGPAGAKRGHDAREALGPVAWPKCTTIAGLADDHELPVAVARRAFAARQRRAVAVVLLHRRMITFSHPRLSPRLLETPKEPS